MKVVYVAIKSPNAQYFESSLRGLCAKDGRELSFHEYDSDVLDDDPLIFREMLDNCRDADMVFVRSATDPNKMARFQRLESALGEFPGYVFLFSGNPDVTFLYRKFFKGDDEQYRRLNMYFSNKSKENDESAGVWLYNTLNGIEGSPEPIAMRMDGIYHPDFPDDIGPEEYVRHLSGKRPVVGIIFPANLHSYRNLDHIDALIRGLESAGMDTLPVFQGLAIYNTETSRGTVKTIHRYFMDGDRVLIDGLIVASPFSQLNTSRSVDGISTPDEENFFHTVLDVPVFQVMSVSRHYADYEECGQGLNKSEITMNVYWPEIDGQVITVPIGSVENTRNEKRRFTAIQDRIEHVAKTVGGWMGLASKPASERRIAVLLYQPHPGSGRIGNSACLDTVESLSDMLKRFSREGYTVDSVPENGRELIDSLMDSITNDLEPESSARVLDKAVYLMDRKEYAGYYGALPQFNRSRMEDTWGEPPGEVAVEKGRMVVPGIVNGNIFVGYQPARSWADQMDSVYHDPVIPMPHQYLGFYRWLKHDFGADAVIHLGTHGTVEWLPGKNVGLSGKCYPDIVLDGIPNIYPYMINDPGEGIQAKRRSEAVLIGHMCITMARAGSYDQLSAVEVPLQEYFKMRGSYREEQRTENVAAILDAAAKADLLKDLGLPDDISAADFEEHVFELHDYITDVKDAVVRDGLHILGRPPEGEEMDEMVYSLMRMDNGGIPSLRDSYSEALGYDIGLLLAEPSEYTNGRLNSQIVDGIEDGLMSLLSGMRSEDYDRDACLGMVSDIMTDRLRASVSYICDTLVPNLMRTTDEMDNLMHACAGGYVLPGPSGAPTRGNASILPTGRNYYGLDPDTIPPRSSWEVGRRMADQMVRRYVDDKGCYPREIAFIIWATDTVKTCGDDLAYILWLLGVRPVWSDVNGHVTGLEVVPLEELGRPRIDVTVRITGLFRDMFPNLIDMIDDAVRMVAGLDESEEDNFLAANLRKDIIDGLADGLTVDEARRRNSVRIFGCPPGGYGPGVNHAISTGDWKTVEDLADIYASWGSYAYGRGIQAESMKDQFVKRLTRVTATVKNLPDREVDMLDMDDVYGYLGGMNAFIRAYGKQEFVSFMGDGSDPERTRIRDTKEEFQYVLRSKVLNPRFIDGLKKHGYRGVSEIANMTEYAFGWDATSDIVDDWAYERMADRYLFDEDTREWMKDENPHAMMEILERYMEAYERGMWNAKPETVEKLKEIYLDLEERIEEVNDR